MTRQLKVFTFIRAGVTAIAALGILFAASPALAASPTVTTEAATAVHHTDALLNGHLDPDADTVTGCHFEWGTDTSYSGGTLPCAQSTPISSPTDVSATLGFLTDGTTYHIKLVATTASSGTVEGADETLFTPGFPVHHTQLGSLGPDGTANTSFDGNRFGKLAFRQPTRQLFALNANFNGPGGVYGFDGSSPLSYPPLPGFNPLAVGPVVNSQMLAVDSTTGASAGNLYYVSPEGESEQQQVTVSATAGTFKLCFDPDEGGPEPAQCTEDVAYNAEPGFSDGGPGTVSYALRALPALSGFRAVNVVGRPYTVGFGESLYDENVPQLTCVNGSVPLSGGSGCSVATTQQGKPSLVQGFNSSGAPLAGSFPINVTTPFSPPHASGQVGGLAVDSAGNLWIANSSGKRILEYGSGGAYQRSVDVSGQFVVRGGTGGPNSIAFDGEDNLYVAQNGSDGSLWRYGAASGYTDATMIYDKGVSALAVDPATNHVFAAPRSEVEDTESVSSHEIREYDAHGNLLGEFARRVLGTELGFEGLAVDAISGDVYAGYSHFEGGGGRGKILVFDAGTTQKLPTITREPVSGLLGHSVTLNAKVDPETNQVTDCHFSWGLTSTYGNTAPCSPLPGSGSGDVDVSAGLTELLAGRTYHFQIVATNAEGTVKGSDQAFTTLGPLVSTTPAAPIGETTATLNAVVDPAGASATCRFQYGPTEAYGREAPCVPAEQPATDEVQSLEVASTAGTFTLEFEGETTEALPFDAEAAEVQSALRALAAIGPEGVSVTGGPGDASGGSPYAITFEGPHAGRGVETLKVQGSGFSGSEHRAVVSVTSTPKIAVNGHAEGLAPNAIYHFRIEATNVDATSYGADQTFNTYAAAQSVGTCPNDAYRSGASARLPECRAYEQASPVDKNGSHASGKADTVGVSTEGDAVTFEVLGGMPGAVGSQSLQVYLARRGASKWSSSGLLPPAAMGDKTTLEGWTPDLTHAFTEARFTDGADPGVSLIDEDTATRTFTVVQPNPPQLQQFEENKPVGVSADGSLIYFTNTEAQVTPDAAPGVSNLYVWERASSTVSLAGLIPPGPETKCGLEGANCVVPSAGSNIDGFTQQEHVVSPNGDQVVFNAGAGEQLYLRTDSADPEVAETVKVSASQRTDCADHDPCVGTPEPDPVGRQPAHFEYVTPSGSEILFTSCEKLTDDSTAHAVGAANCEITETQTQGSDLYAYNTASGQLADLTPDTTDPLGAQVIGILGASDSGAYVYLVANADLDGEEGPAEAGDCHSHEPPNRANEQNYQGECNLYLWHAGSYTFVARLHAGGESGDALNWVLTNQQCGACGSRLLRSGHVSADGRTALFRTANQLTGYDNHGKREFYRYNTDEGLDCVSCDPTGSPPSGGASVFSIKPPLAGPYSGEQDFPQNLSADGTRAFFETPDRLVAADTNGDVGCPTVNGAEPRCLDVYEWEAPGAGSCERDGAAYASQDGGCIYLISTGKSAEPSFFAGADESGDNVFFFTIEKLVPQDEDGLVDVYDARVDGGLAAQHEEAKPGCEGEACRGKGTHAPSSPGAGSAAFEGPPDKAQPHLRDCGPLSTRARRLARQAKALDRQAGHSSGKSAEQLRRRAQQLAKKAHGLSGEARDCRRANRKARNPRASR